MLTTDVLVDDKKNVSSSGWFRGDFERRDFDGLRDEHDGSGRREFRPDADGRVGDGVSGGAPEGCGVAGFGEFERAGAFGAGAEGAGFGRDGQEGGIGSGFTISLRCTKIHLDWRKFSRLRRKRGGLVCHGLQSAS